MASMAYSDLARLYLNERHEMALPAGKRLPTLRWYKGDIYQYQGTHYKDVDDKLYTAWLTQWLAAKRLGTLKLQRETEAHVIADLVVNSPEKLSSWVQGSDKKGRWLAFKNGIVDLDTLIKTGVPVIVAHTPEFFSTTVLPYNFDEKADCPILKKCLEDWFPGDKDTQALVQEMAGYILWPELPFHGGFFLEGGGRNGKSTLIKVLQNMVGEANYSCLALEAFAGNFALNATIGKLANFASDTDPGAKLPIGTLKRFTGDESLTIDRKYQKQVTVKVTTKLVVAWNERPIIKDMSDGFWHRIRIIPFKVQFREGDKKTDTALDEKLAVELPGILNWAVAGLQRLLKNRKFTVSAAGVVANKNFRDQSDPIRAYLNEYWERADGHVPKQAMYNHYCENRIDPEAEELPEGKFFKEVYRCLPGVEPTRIRSSSNQGLRMPVVSGIKLKEVLND